MYTSLAESGLHATSSLEAGQLASMISRMTDDTSDKGRRAFLNAGITVMGAGLAGAVAVPAVRLVLHPLNNEVTSGGQDFVVVGDRSKFGETPVRVEIFADRKDAWNRAEHVRIGAAFVVAREGRLVAFSTVCPHLGCAIDFDAGSDCFRCPCHRSRFDLDGTVTEGPAPRGLDELDVEDRDGSIAVMYRRFRQGVAQKEPLT